jgi:hypothetical protein
MYFYVYRHVPHGTHLQQRVEHPSGGGSEGDVGQDQAVRHGGQECTPVALHGGRVPVPHVHRARLTHTTHAHNKHHVSSM